MAATLIDEVITLNLSFAGRTGLGGAPRGPRQRYLWTDAFAVCNFVGLARRTGDDRYMALALELVDRVHHVLGRHRDDDARRGWISGLDDSEAETHPTVGGLRIGKPIPERTADEPVDEVLEWERDGQYFHYLTRWMHALDQVSRATGQPHFNRWARELADTAYRAFSHAPTEVAPRRRLYWKMSIDLRRPLVASMGHHDPLDGYVIGQQLRWTAEQLDGPLEGPDLRIPCEQLGAMIAGADWVTADPLGLGGLLIDACRVDQLLRAGAPLQPGLLEELLSAALSGLWAFARGRELQKPAGARLPFRELGLAIGLHAVRLMARTTAAPSHPALAAAVRSRLQALMVHSAMGDAIEAFWRRPEHRAAPTWASHRDINDVMLASALAPEGVLLLSSRV